MRIVALTSLLATSTRAFHPSFSGFSAFRRTNSKALFQRQMTVSGKEALFECPSIPLYDNTSHPAIGFGTYKVGFIPASASSAVAAAAPTSVERTAEECVTDALAVGYRFLECAEFYVNESEVGKAKLSKLQEFQEKNCLFALKFGQRQLRRGKMRFVHNWRRH
jgi:hypothetical protein